MDFKSKTVSELQDIRRTIDELIEQKKVEAKQSVQDQIHKIVKDSGFTLEQLLDLKPSSAKLKAQGDRRAGKVAPKYRNPKTGETWTGRGRRPVWIAETLAAGEPLDQLLI